MAPRKKDTKPAKPSARKKQTTAPQAAASNGATFNNQYRGNEWG